MRTKRDKPSTKARREGYARLHRLEHLLLKLLFPRHKPDLDEVHWFEVEFAKDGWKDYMIRHTPALKRGGPSEPSKRRRSKKADRNSQVRSGLRR